MVLLATHIALVLTARYATWINLDARGKGLCYSVPQMELDPGGQSPISPCEEGLST